MQIALAFDDDELIAHYAVSPTILSFGEKEIKSAQSMTTMTHPHYEGKGLFTRLASLLFEKLRRDGYESVYSFPNQSSHGIFIKKLNFQDIKKLDKVYRINLINSITGAKPANLIGTKSTNSVENLAVFSSVVHLGSNPPLIGFFIRPQIKKKSDRYFCK